MSLPLLSNSPTVMLKVGTDRRLRADLVLSPDTANGLMVRPGGLYAKKAQRRYPWMLFMNTGFLGTIGNLPVGGPSFGPGLTANQSIPFGTEKYDPAGLVDLVNFPTRVTIPEACRVFSNVSLQLGASATTYECGQVLLMRNGSILEGAQTLSAGSGTATVHSPVQVIGCLSSWVDCAAGDYLELFWRWTNGFSGLGNGLMEAVWSGGAITA